METTIRIHIDDLNANIIEGIKKMFAEKTIEITIHAADTTEYILDNPDYTQELLERIEEYNKKQKVILLKEDELV
jgi:tRNA A37 methylthiotransferase MiaB